MNYSCLFCKKICVADFISTPAGLNISSCDTCQVEYHWHQPNKETRMFRYKIFGRYRDKTYALSIFTHLDVAQLYQIPDDPEDTHIMITAIIDANIKEKINPSNFLEKLPTLLTFL